MYINERTYIDAESVIYTKSFDLRIKDDGLFESDITYFTNVDESKLDEIPCVELELNTGRDVYLSVSDVIFFKEKHNSHEQYYYFYEIIKDQYEYIRQFETDNNLTILTGKTL